jgi:hypothetical protein
MGKNAWWVTTLFAIIWLLLTLAHMVAWNLKLGEPCWVNAHKKGIGLLMVVSWAIGPPIWFVAEYSISATSPEKLKEDQDIVKPIWAGFAAVIGAIYFNSLK